MDDELTTPVPQAPSLKTVKELTSNADGDQSGNISLGDVLTYTVTVTNTGNTTLTDVTATDNRITPGMTTCSSLAPGQECILVGTYTVTVDDILAGKIVNTARRVI